MAKGKADETAKLLHEVEYVDPSTLTPHPKNYQTHTDDQLEHIIKNIKRNGVYRNIIIANDGVILAGHGVVQAVMKMGLKKVPVVKLNIKSDSSQAMKVLIGDNEIGSLATVNDRLLTDMLKDIKDTDRDGLLGTGFDDAQLAALVFVTRPTSELTDKSEAQEWVGMPEYTDAPDVLHVNVSFMDEKGRESFFKKLGIPFTAKTRAIWWPNKEKADVISIKVEG